jgi:uncharacterized protein (TIGR02118 family)
VICVSAIYSNEPGTRFDGEYYIKKHTPMAKVLMSPLGLREIRTILGLEALDGSAAPYWAVSEMLFDTREKFDAAMAACGEALFADLPNYTNTTPVLQISTLASG